MITQFCHLDEGEITSVARNVIASFLAITYFRELYIYKQ